MPRHIFWFESWESGKLDHPEAKLARPPLTGGGRSFRANETIRLGLAAGSQTTPHAADLGGAREVLTDTRERRPGAACDENGLFAEPLQSPLTDSNRRPPPYHGG
jgi:hypothetical protein